MKVNYKTHKLVTLSRFNDKVKENELAQLKRLKEKYEEA